jgi:hypothetical protein
MGPLSNSLAWSKPMPRFLMLQRFFVALYVTFIHGASAAAMKRRQREINCGATTGPADRRARVSLR